MERSLAERRQIEIGHADFAGHQFVQQRLEQAFEHGALDAIGLGDYSDAARDVRILPLLRESTETSLSLYEGLQAEALVDVAPYLVELPAQSDLRLALLELGWDNQWGIYCRSKDEIARVRQQLRRLLIARDEGGEDHHSRFYDPRVLCGLIDKATPRQRHQLFDNIDTFITSGANGATLRFTRDRPSAETLVWPAE